MYCENCGSQITDPGSEFCPNCGAPLHMQTNQFGMGAVDAEVVSKGNGAKTLGIIAIVFSFIIPLVSWICGGIGISRANRAFAVTGDAVYKSYKKLCVIGIVIAIVLWVINIIFSVVSGALMRLTW